MHRRKPAQNLHQAIVETPKFSTIVGDIASSGCGLMQLMRALVVLYSTNDAITRHPSRRHNTKKLISLTA
jgi:hypothetical protein